MTITRLRHLLLTATLLLLGTTAFAQTVTSTAVLDPINRQRGTESSTVTLIPVDVQDQVSIQLTIPQRVEYEDLASRLCWYVYIFTEGTWQYDGGACWDGKRRVTRNGTVNPMPSVNYRDANLERIRGLPIRVDLETVGVPLHSGVVVLMVVP